MAVTVRLARAGAKKKPYYHVVATDSRNPRDGKFIEAIGMYDPNFNPPKFQLDEARYAHWMKIGARPSDTIVTLRKAAAKKQPAKA